MESLEVACTEGYHEGVMHHCKQLHCVGIVLNSFPVRTSLQEHNYGLILEHGATLLRNLSQM